MRALFVISCLALLVLPTGTSAEVKTFTATHTYILGDHDSKDDARQRCLLEAKRKVLEQAGVLIESASEVKDFQLTKDKITSFAAAVMQVKDTKEKVGFENGHMTMTLTIKAGVDLAEVRKQLAARQVDKSVRDEVTQQQERLKRLEAQFDAMQKQIQQGGQVARQAPASPPSDISSQDLKKLKVRAAKGDAEAQLEIGYRYILGEGVPQDYETARSWFEKAAAQGDAKAQYNLGQMYANGWGVPKDETKARQWWEKAAAQGIADAQYNLGTWYDEGQGVPQDYTTARQWYEKAAAQGYAIAQNNLGMLYAKGRGVLQDSAQARQWFEKAAAQGNALAQYNLGELYAYGVGVPQDYVKARQWYEKAAAQGDTSAQFHLGALYHQGQGVQQDNVLARKWFEKAAAHGHAWAQNNLGVLYAHGWGVLQDNVKAYIWYSLAASRLLGAEQKTTAEMRDEIAHRLTPSQLAEAQRLTQQCQARQFKGC